jgi:hypothetical protein
MALIGQIIAEWNLAHGVADDANAPAKPGQSAQEVSQDSQHTETSAERTERFLQADDKRPYRSGVDLKGDNLN